jgi:hypothetical protein
VWRSKVDAGVQSDLLPLYIADVSELVLKRRGKVRNKLRVVLVVVGMRRKAKSPLRLKLMMRKIAEIMERS